MMKFGIVLLLLVLLIGVSIALVNRLHVPAAQKDSVVKGGQPDALAGKVITAVTWNIGYAGMGKGADFVLDGGVQTRPTDRKLVESNLAKITAKLGEFEADVILLQEVAQPSFSTHQVDVLAGLRSVLSDASMTFGADIRLFGIPAPINTKIGNASFSWKKVLQAETRGLPLERAFKYGFFRKSYRMHITYLDGSPEWVFINLHLAAFDPESDQTREDQLRAALRFAVSQYEAGRHVILGGDFNLRLAPTEFPHQTNEATRFWIRDLPDTILSDGWKIAVDSERPTARTADAPYVSGVNYRLIIDGFIVSPNVRPLEIETSDLDFEFTDHNPVLLKAQAIKE